MVTISYAVLITFHHTTQAPFRHHAAWDAGTGGSSYTKAVGAGENSSSQEVAPQGLLTQVVT